MSSNSNKPGLPSLNDARETRKRQLVMGRAVVGGIPPRWFLGGFVVLVGILAVTYFRAQSELNAKKSELLAKQRAVKATLGPKLFPIREAVEKAVRETRVPGDSVEPGVDFERLLASPGVYLRVMAKDAADATSLRRAAADYSLRDGFTSCFVRDPKGPLPKDGPACERSTDCEAGNICTEFKVCQRPSSPFNMRLVYRALLVLSESWEEEVKNAGSEINLRAHDLVLESTTRVDVPVAADVYQRAKYAIVVVDEMPKEGLPVALGEPGDESEFERLGRTPHDARVGIVELPSGKMLARVAGRAEGEIRAMTPERDPQGPFAVAARSRQVNGCALALGVRAKLIPAGP